jgi:predicted porin
MHKVVLRRTFTAMGLALAAPGIAHAQAVGVPGPSAPAVDVAARGAPQSTTPMQPGPPPLTWHGITIYGVIDVAGVYQTHGTAYNANFAPTLEYVISKNSTGSRATYASNALSQSKVGLKGKEHLFGDVSLVFLGETHINPTGGRLSNGLKSVVNNNGRPQNAQSSNGDSSKDGQAFAGQAYFGLSSDRFGTITFGRQWNLMLDNIVNYDPLVASHAFSVVGYQGAAQAGAATEEARLDRSLKYALREGHARVIGMFEFGDEQLPTARAYGVDVGYDLGHLSVDVDYMHLNDSISSGPLSAAQFAVLPHDSLSATISDNNSWGVFAKYVIPKWKFFGAVERIEYENPHHALVPGYHTIGGFLLGAINNQAFPNHKFLTYSWAGVSYSPIPRLSLTAAYYRADQNSYGVKDCHDTSAATCSGHLNALSLVADYRFTRRVDVYTGAMYSAVADGLASGFLHRNSVDPAVGVRFSF